MGEWIRARAQAGAALKTHTLKEENSYNYIRAVAVRSARTPDHKRKEHDYRADPDAIQAAAALEPIEVDSEVMQGHLRKSHRHGRGYASLNDRIPHPEPVVRDFERLKSMLNERMREAKRSPGKHPMDDSSR